MNVEWCHSFGARGAQLSLPGSSAHELCVEDSLAIEASKQDKDFPLEGVAWDHPIEVNIG
jgi:hypothetical protein